MTIILNAAYLLLNGPTFKSIRMQGIVRKREEDALTRRIAVMKAAWGQNSTIDQLRERTGYSRDLTAGSVRELVKQGVLKGYRVGAKTLYTVVPEKYKRELSRHE